MFLNCLIFSSKSSLVTPRYAALQSIQKNLSAARLNSFLCNAASSAVSLLRHCIQTAASPHTVLLPVASNGCLSLFPSSTHRFSNQYFTFIRLDITAIAILKNTNFLTGYRICQLQCNAGLGMNAKIIK